jgi:two-component system sensor histidine kinase VicK
MTSANGDAGGDTVRRPFSLLFVDPLLVASDPADDLPVRKWTINVAVESDPALTTAIAIANRALAVAAFATAVLTLGLVLSVRAARASAELSEMRSDFVSTVTHEIKTPIASIRAIGDTIVSGRASGSVLVECAHLLVQESKRLTRLVDNLLAYSRITDVTDAYLFEPMNVSAMVEEIIEGFAWQLRDLQFVVQLDIPPALPLIRGDRTALRLAFDNVVDNAIRYSGEVRSLRVTATAANGSVDVAVADRGVGIPSDEVPLVTRRFFRGRAAKSGGSGLGLPIAHRIVSDHGGTLTVSSEVGRGTTMRITLPQARSDHGEERP